MRSYDKEQPRVAIIGGGLAGISTGIALKRQLKYTNFLIYEKGSDVGGTWRDNTYPNCSSDIAGHWYSLSSDLNPNWSSYYASQPEILAYWKGLVKKYSLHDNLVLNTRVVSAIWDDVTQKYRLLLRDEKTGAEREEFVEAIVTATGGVSKAAYPKDIADIDQFKGPMFHSSCWNHDVSLSGKRVGVIGNAASAVQLIPRISDDPTVEVINFSRTANWFVSRGPNPVYPSWIKWTFSHVPFVMRAYRNYLGFKHELSYLIFVNSNKRIQRYARKGMTKYLKARAPKQYIEKLIPDYPPGCKRIVLNYGYLSALHRPNVSLTWDAIDKIVPDGIIKKNGEMVPLDVIVFATGFEASFRENFQGALRIDLTGRDKKTLEEYYVEHGGPTAYLGTTMPRFPNFFMLLGPNTATGHTSIIFSEEAQINYALQLLKPVIEKKVASFTVRATAADKYNELIQRRFIGSVFPSCASYYRSGMTGKHFAIFPGPIVLFWWWVRRPRWADYEVRGGEAWIRERRRRTLLRTLGMALLLAGVAGASHPSTWDVLKTVSVVLLSMVQSLLK
ncbi:hypothetical protein EW145_g1153 [Phellinidium pouzarii]|uniref:Uncharacterized protein n=1 Tax=Phellinidium pouzarii TaxID=167371 RepID=A0A4S4LHE5_9AGAM|nr:hypothetical protein EW145_g1153 [Phellinidium pouzarii]